VLDMVAGEYINRNISCLADDGRIVLIAVLGGAKATIDASQILRRRLVLTGSTLRPRPVEFKKDIAQSLQRHVWPLLESGKIRPIVHATFLLARACDAHAMMDAGEQIGKIVLTV